MKIGEPLKLEKIYSTEFVGRDMTCKFEPRVGAYKRTLHYPLNERARSLCRLLGVKSLSDEKARYVHNNIMPLQFETEQQWYENAA